MKHNKMNRIGHYSSSMQGFTLIEFLVASVLAMIVIVAASGTYLITRRLNHTVQQRISTQQDIRNASVQIARDARMAGNFGCFSTASTIDGKSFEKMQASKATGTVPSDGTAMISLDPERKDGYGVRLIAKEDLRRLTGVTNPSDGLLFIYGQGAMSVKVDGLDAVAAGSSGATISSFSLLMKNNSSDETATLLQSLTGINNERGDIILSSCQTPYLFTPNRFDSRNKVVGVNNLATKFTESESGELTASKLYASLYLLDDIAQGQELKWNGEKALIRFDIGANGKWSSPQLLSRGINDKNNDGIKFSFGYVSRADDGSSDRCPKGVSGDATDPDETYDFVSSPNLLNWNAGAKFTLPAVVQIRLKYFTNKPTGRTQETDAQTAHYIMNAVVRGGNTCANRVVAK